MVNLGLTLLLVMPVSIISTHQSSAAYCASTVTARLLALGNWVQITHRTVSTHVLMQLCNLSGGHRAILKFPYIPGKVLYIVNSKISYKIDYEGSKVKELIMSVTV